MLATFSVEGGLVLVIPVACLTIFANIWHHFSDPKSLRRFLSPSIAAFTPFWMIWHNARGRRFQAVEDAHRSLGPMRIGPNSLSFSDPQAYKEIYGHGSNMIKDVFYDNLAGSTPSMADTSDRQMHSLKRKHASHIFSAKNIMAMEPKVIAAVQKLLKAINIKSSGGRVSEADHYTVSEDGEFDLRPWLNMFSFDAISSMLWSAPYGFLHRGDDRCESMDAHGKVSTVHAMETFQSGVQFSILCAHLGPLAYRLSRKLTQWLPRNRAADEFTGMARYQTTMRVKRSPDGIDFFTFLPTEVTAERPVPMLLPELVAECTAFLNAGNDTTQISLSNVMYQLATHPTQEDKLYKLLTKSLPQQSQPIATFAQLNRVPYLTACLDETFRLTPPVRFGLPRRTMSECTIIGGQPVAPGVTVAASLYTMHREPNLFHKAEEWIPERWIPTSDESSEEELKDLKDFVLPFSLGGRACIGRNLAYMEVSNCLAALVMAFEWKISDAGRRSFVHFERLNCSPVKLIISAEPRKAI